MRIITLVSLFLFQSVLFANANNLEGVQSTSSTAPQINFDQPPSFDAKFVDNDTNQNDTAQSFGSAYEEEPDFLPVEDAFLFDFIQDAQKIEITFEIEKGYYLYKKQFKFATNNASVGQAVFPEGIPYQDEYFGETEIYKNSVTILLPINFALDDGELKIRYQGCAEAGLCYPPSVKNVPLIPVNSTADSTAVQSLAEFDESESGLNSFLQEQTWYVALGIFFILGVGLSLTPCVFPMYPILSSIIAGQGNITTRQAVTLSFLFVQGMAITYALLGLIAAFAGASFQAILQSEAVLISLSLMFVILAIGMFGAFELQLPSNWINKLNSKSQQQKQGNAKGAFIMGILSGLIASPCTTAPLSGALLYVAQTGDSLFGFITLYILSLGMGLPLLIIGASAGKWLPKAGLWMDSVKKLFAFILLAVPLLLLSRFLSEHIILWLTALLTLSTAAFFAWQFINKQSVKLSLAVSIISAVLTAWFAMQAANYKSLELPFEKLTQIHILTERLNEAKASSKPVMLDITAEWCVGCKEFEHITFANIQVQETLKDYVWLQLDVTDYNDEHDTFIKSFNIVGPPAPTVLIINESGIELVDKRIRGFLPPTDFINAVIAPK